MSGLGPSLRTLAGETIEQYGITLTLHRAPGDYDPSTGKRPGSPTPEPVASTPPDQWVERTTSGRTAPTKDTRFIVPGTALSTPPAVNDQVEYAGITYIITELAPVWAGDTVVLWQLRARG